MCTRKIWKDQQIILVQALLRGSDPTNHPIIRTLVYPAYICTTNESAYND